jgi:hypothetical protein
LLREFVISVASGFAVAILSAIFLRRPMRGGRNAPTQSMGMNTTSGGGVGQLFLFFLLGAAVALAILMYTQGRFAF